jgi:hypothetical protein
MRDKLNMITDVMQALSFLSFDSPQHTEIIYNQRNDLERI